MAYRFLSRNKFFKTVGIASSGLLFSNIDKEEEEIVRNNAINNLNMNEIESKIKINNGDGIRLNNNIYTIEEEEEEEDKIKKSFDHYKEKFESKLILYSFDNNDSNDSDNVLNEGKKEEDKNEEGPSILLSAISKTRVGVTDLAQEVSSKGNFLFVYIKKIKNTVCSYYECFEKLIKNILARTVLCSAYTYDFVKENFVSVTTIPLTGIVVYLLLKTFSVGAIKNSIFTLLITLSTFIALNPHCVTRYIYETTQTDTRESPLQYTIDRSKKFCDWLIGYTFGYKKNEKVEGDNELISFEDNDSDSSNNEEENTDYKVIFDGTNELSDDNNNSSSDDLLDSDDIVKDQEIVIDLFVEDNEELKEIESDDSDEIVKDKEIN
eukprot:TRINITY_DN2243_c1_g1_i1.p1 TRINITY_DN2243_c1_g1~~TRINITY_DN2243_c1_g1_i1.p1  ORF type:complete len:379 (+),score=128.11 TRINITY_DN2243_c1_g1_i1:81-1217(+)